MVNNLITELLEEGVNKPLPTWTESNESLVASRIPTSLPPANGLNLSAEDEVLFRYFCVGKPQVWISTRQFNRDVPLCLVYLPPLLVSDS